MPADPNPEIQVNPLATVMAWVLPGAGHMVLGHRTRGLLIMVGVLGMFFTGVLIGGIDCVDRREDRLWFLAQAVTGPVAFITDYANQSLLKTGKVGEIVFDAHTNHEGKPVPAVSSKKSLGKVNEMGTLFTALAGLMNLAVILDTLHHPSGPMGRPHVKDRRGSGS